MNVRIPGQLTLAACVKTGILIDSHELAVACASVAHLAEQLICNQQVVGSSPSASSKSGSVRQVRLNPKCRLNPRGVKFKTTRVWAAGSE